MTTTPLTTARRIVVTGTDTGIGKTAFAAMLTLALDGCYWKPVQSGTVDGTDSATVAALTGLGAACCLPERYVLSDPFSPHLAAERDGVTVDPEALANPPDPPAGRPLIIEGAGGLMVPLNRQTLLIDLFARWRVPVVLCARTGLGTINHTLLSVEALRRRAIPILGIAFIGAAMPDTEHTIPAFAGVKRLGRLPWFPEGPTADTLRAAFATNFRREDFTGDPA